MFGRKKDHPPKNKGGGKALMQQLGFDTDFDAPANDTDLEAELAALLQSETTDSPKSKRHVAKASAADSGVAAVAQLDQMVAACLKNVPDDDDDDSQLDDPDLLAELETLTSEADSDEPPEKKQGASCGGSNRNTVLEIEDRLAMYRKAHGTARGNNDESKAKRLNRGIKTLEDLLKKAHAGKPIAEDDIPPRVSMSASAIKQTPEKSIAGKVTTPTSSLQQKAVVPSSLQQKAVLPPAVMEKPTVVYSTIPDSPTHYVKPAVQPSPQPSPRPSPRPSIQPSAQPALPNAQDEAKYKVLTSRRDGYKMGALHAKKLGDTANAVKYIGVAKQFDKVIEALQNGQPVDLSQMPAPLPAPGSSPEERPVQRVSMQGSAEPHVPADLPETTCEDRQKLYLVPEAARSTDEALRQRLDKYKSAMTEAKESGNDSKARRTGRIVKQYEDAIKATKAGRAYDYSELPNPPGFPPIPTPTTSPSPQQGAVAAAKQVTSTVSPLRETPAITTRPSPEGNKTRPMSSGSRASKQTAFLQQRQLQFKKAALHAKQTGDIQLAKKYLRLAMGFDQMISASESGLPVDLSQVPSLPSDQTETEFVVVSPDGSTDDNAEPLSGDRREMYEKLQQQLLDQIKMATSNSERFMKLGDVSTAAKFDVLCASASKDMDALKNAFKHGDPVPRFHYEMRQLSVVKCCSHLGDNDLEINIIRGVNYALPSGYSSHDLHTYIKHEFPFPTDSPQKGSTDVCKSDSPEYNQTFKVDISRKSRSFLRLLKNKTIKFEIFYRRGFLKSDKLLATVTCKLQPLENVSVIHDSFDLMDGKKAVGGKLELKISVRDPFVSKQVEELKQKWLVIEHFARNTTSPQIKSSKTKAAPNVPQSSSNTAVVKPFTSIEVLKYERQLLDQQIRRYQGKLTATEEAALQRKSELLESSIDDHKNRLKQGGKPALQEYLNAIEKAEGGYVEESKAMAAQGNRDKAQILMTKKKLVEKEIAMIQSRMKSL